MANALEFLGYGYTRDGIYEYFQPEPERKVLRITNSQADNEDYEEFDELPEDYWETTNEEEEDLYNTYWEAYL